MEGKPFARADLERKLLMVDNDMDMSALSKTNYLKATISNQGMADMTWKDIAIRGADIPGSSAISTDIFYNYSVTTCLPAHAE